jgi:acyl-CoA dehydrogenase
MSGTPPRSELRAILEDAAARLLGDLATPEVIAAAERGVWPEALWKAVEDSGLTLPVVAEARGGGGATWTDAYVLVLAAGRHAAPIPFAETIIAAWLLAEAGLDLPDGALTIASGGASPLILSRAGGGWRLTGTAARVPWGGSASHIVAVADSDGDSAVALVPRGAATHVVHGNNVALEPRDTLTFQDTPVVSAARLPGSLGFDPVRTYGALIRSAQMAGALEWMLGQSVRYSTERKQFGRAIGAFQAIQHQLAVLAGHTAAAGIAAERAFAAADRGDPRFEVAVAKTRVGEAAGIGASIAHQVHGAIGFSHEHSLHFLTRRLWAWRAEFGAEVEWATELGRTTAARGADAFWPDVTAR